jgi:serine/threonine-protein kinase
MGEVYRAKDPSLNRDIAIKVLPATVTGDAERRARFEHEARMAAGLNHAGIVTIHSVEHDRDRVFITMELVKGKPLADLIPHHGLSIDKLLAIAVPLANAVSAAHDNGITHRDLKPANVIVGDDGAVKVLDFGIAKRHDIDASSHFASTASLATAEGRLLGTVAYMSPEQAEGKPADKRADVFSLGTMLYEMATGRRPFSADTAVATLAAIVRDPPAPIADVNPGVPKELARIIRRALAKDPDRRQQSAKDLRNELDELRRDLESDRESPSFTGDGSIRARRPQSLRLIATAAAALVAAVAAWAWTRTLDDNPVARSPAVTFDLALSEGAQAVGGPVVSNDGTTIAFVAIKGNSRDIYVRRVDALTPRPLPGTTGGLHPFFSPDGRRLAFFANGQLRVTEIEGGVPHVVCPAGDARGGTWGEDDVIVFAAMPETALSRVPAAGGNPAPFTVLGPGESSHRFPHDLPGGAGVLFTVVLSSGASSIAVQRAGASSHSIVTERGFAPRFAQGQMYFGNDHLELSAAPFDLRSLSLTGPPTARPEQVNLGVNLHDFAYSVGRDGTLAYRPFEAPQRSMEIVGRDGSRSVVPGPPRGLSNPQVSPDGETIAVTIQATPDWGDIWLIDRQGNLRPLTRDNVSRFKTWSPDGRQLAVESRRSGQGAVYVHSVDGQIAPRQVLAQWAYPQSWWRPDTLLMGLYNIPGSPGLERMAWLKIGADAPEPLKLPIVQSAYGRVSPDGRWVAYTNRESGQWEVYVARHPYDGRVWPVSQAGTGREMVWAKSARPQLYFLRDNGQLMTSAPENGETWASAPRLVAGVGTFPRSAVGPGLPQYDVFPDGSFVVARDVDERPVARFVVTTNR